MRLISFGSVLMIFCLITPRKFVRRSQRLGWICASIVRVSWGPQPRRTNLHRREHTNLICAHDDNILGKYVTIIYKSRELLPQADKEVGLRKKTKKQKKKQRNFSPIWFTFVNWTERIKIRLGLSLRARSQYAMMQTLKMN